MENYQTGRHDSTDRAQRRLYKKDRCLIFLRRLNKVVNRSFII